MPSWPSARIINGMQYAGPHYQQRDSYGQASALDPWYVTGLTEGEGCFCVSFTRRPTLRTGLEVRPSFSLSLNENDKGLLEELQSYFGCGWIRQSRSDRTFKFESRAVGELIELVVPHFERYPLRGAKARSFEGFSRICEMIEQGDISSVWAWKRSSASLTR